MESAETTIGNVAASVENTDKVNVCAFCGKAAGSDLSLLQGMFREIKSELTLVSERKTIERIVIKIPCCLKCHKDSRTSLKHRKGISIAVAFGSMMLTGFIGFKLLLYSDLATFEPSKAFLYLLIIPCFSGFVTSHGLYWLLSRNTKGQIRKHPLVAALLSAGWSIGASSLEMGTVFSSEPEMK